ncbi:MAG: Holliday junction resolvase RuvX [Patescibacteria group bacterium]
MKYLGLDYGKARVGMAIGTDETKVAVGKGILEGLTQNKLITKIKAIVNIEGMDRIIVGLPLSMDGQENDMSKEVKLFVEKLRGHLEIPVQTFDERLTSQMADNLLREVKGVKKQDQVAAQIILQNYLDQQAK